LVRGMAKEIAGGCRIRGLQNVTWIIVFLQEILLTSSEAKTVLENSKITKGSILRS